MGKRDKAAVEQVLVRLNNVLCEDRITSGQAVNAVAQLLAIVLMNATDTAEECSEILDSVMESVEQCIDTNWPLAAAARSLEKTSKGNH